MPDNKHIPGPQDRKRIDLNDPDEIRNWTKSLGCTEIELRAAVAKAGSDYADLVRVALPEIRKGVQGTTDVAAAFQGILARMRARKNHDADHS